VSTYEEMKKRILDTIGKAPMTGQEIWRMLGSPQDDDAFYLDCAMVRLADEGRINHGRQGSVRTYWAKS
jgi:hypothetical protein